MLLIRPRALVLLPLLMALALVSCGTSIGDGAATTPASPDSTAVPYGLPPVTAIIGLHALRMSASTQNRVAPFEKTSTNVAEVQRLYAAVLKLKPFPPHVVLFCPVNVGVTYQLGFLRQGASPVQAVYGGGCPGISLERRILQIVDWPGFSHFLAEALGVPVSHVALAGTGIVDSAPPGGPFAPATSSDDATSSGVSGPSPGLRGGLDGCST